MGIGHDRPSRSRGDRRIPSGGVCRRPARAGRAPVCQRGGVQVCNLVAFLSALLAVLDLAKGSSLVFRSRGTMEWCNVGVPAVDAGLFRSSGHVSVLHDSPSHSPRAASVLSRSCAAGFRTHRSLPGRTAEVQGMPFACDRSIRSDPLRRTAQAGAGQAGDRLISKFASTDHGRYAAVHSIAILPILTIEYTGISCLGAGADRPDSQVCSLRDRHTCLNGGSGTPDMKRPGNPCCLSRAATDVP